MIINKKSWHFKIYNWFNEGERVPRDLCSYGRTVMFWAPLKAIFFAPWRAIFMKSKVMFSIVMLLLLGAMEAIVFAVSFQAGGVFNAVLLLIIGIAFVCGVFAVLFITTENLQRKWQRDADTNFVQYTKKTGRVMGVGLKYSLGFPLKYILWLPLKAIFWTTWEKMYEFNRVLFGTVLTITIGGICWLLVFVGLGQLLVGIGIVIGIILFVIGCFALGAVIKKADLKNSMVWQWIKARKQKACPLIELRD